jgi:hypothetical protein
MDSVALCGPHAITTNFFIFDIRILAAVANERPPLSVDFLHIFVMMLDCCWEWYLGCCSETYSGSYYFLMVERLARPPNSEGSRSELD